MIVALVVCVALSAFFSASETAFSSLNKIRMKAKAEAGDARAARTLEFAENYDELLSTILIGNNIVNIAASSLGTVLFTIAFKEYGPTVSTVALTVIILIFGEISPKGIAKENAEMIAMAVTAPLKLIRAVFHPLNILFMAIKRFVSGLVKSNDDNVVTEEELITYVSEVENEGGLEEAESQLIRNAIEFNDVEVSEILVPRVDICAVEDSATVEEIAAAFAESGYSRLPVYHDSIDTIVGVIHEKDFYNARFHGDDNLSAIMKQPTCTTYSVKIPDLLRTLQKDKTHMA
ncbi:MAG: HlyC/CorC family transporter, partial [Clostridia bacterium]|nr:HlyC/CorC family transporter [Clostridia bacterium]